ncbi:uncharacterized protein JCM6883_003075 [Sporobolomyces salmoneus]|uniref:uncharacterized protein n=1 Tax=Sporobolomyces salmoneus TaxID=183962 RepID=UPI00317F51EF
MAMQAEPVASTSSLPDPSRSIFSSTTSNQAPQPRKSIIRLREDVWGALAWPAVGTVQVEEEEMGHRQPRSNSETGIGPGEQTGATAADVTDHVSLAPNSRREGIVGGVDYHSRSRNPSSGVSAPRRRRSSPPRRRSPSPRRPHPSTRWPSVAPPSRSNGPSRPASTVPFLGLSVVQSSLQHLEDYKPYIDIDSLIEPLRSFWYHRQQIEFYCRIEDPELWSSRPESRAFDRPFYTALNLKLMDARLDLERIRRDFPLEDSAGESKRREKGHPFWPALEETLSWIYNKKIGSREARRFVEHIPENLLVLIRLHVDLTRYFQVVENAFLGFRRYLGSKRFYDLPPTLRRARDLVEWLTRYSSSTSSPRAPSILDYHSDCSTFALSISPLSTSSPSSLKLAIGSYNEHRTTLPPTNSPSTSNQQQQQQQGNNNLTIASLDPNYLDLEDDLEDESELALRSRSTGARVQAGSAFQPVARANLVYPPSAVQFAPARLSASLGGGGGDSHREVVATSSECLRLWDLVTEGGGGDDERGGFVGSHHGLPRSRLVSRATLQNSKVDYSAPLTSFSWSVLEPTHIVTSSIDTTCTVWDISTGAPVTQLIAHDREVYDVAWSPASREVFASVGADGSVRMFDLRSLEHSTILYEAAPPPSTSNSSSSNPASSATKRNGSSGGASSSPNHNSNHSSSTNSASTAIPSPLLRLAFSPTSPTYLSVVHADSGDVQILDTRSPGTPAFEVKGHKNSINGMAWGGETMHSSGGSHETTGPGWLATVSDDSTLLLWDLTTAQPNLPPTSRSVPQQPKTISTPSLAYTAPSEINSVTWGGGGEWVAIGCGKLVRCLRV